MDTLYNILPDHLVAILTALVALCAAITTVLPPPKEDGNKVYRSFYKLTQWIALNLGRAKNAQDTIPKPAQPEAASPKEKTP